jgi:hypothetical protein
MAKDSQHEKRVSELLSELVEGKLISAPQMQMVVADAAATGMSVVEVLIARRWVSEETLHSIAPWTSEAKAPPQPVSNDQQSGRSADGSANDSTDDFEENLRKYRELMDSILGEANK